MATLNNIRLNGTTYQIGGSGSGGGGTGYYGICSSYAETQAKTVTVDDSFSLVKGVVVNVVFDNQNTASSPTLNVNNTGAKPITGWGDSPATQADWGDYTLVSLVYTGTKWRMIIPADADADTKGLVRLSDTYSSNNTTAATPKAVNAALAAAKTYTDNKVSGSTSGATPTIVNTDGSITASDIYDLADGEYWFAEPFEQGSYMTGTSLTATYNTLLVGYVLCVSHVMYCQATGYSVKFVSPTTVGSNDHAESGVRISKMPPLPVVTVVDSGKVLTVSSSGKWEAADPPSGSSVTLSSATDSTSETTAATSKAVADALTAAKSYADDLIGGIENGTY